MKSPSKKIKNFFKGQSSSPSSEKRGLNTFVMVKTRELILGKSPKGLRVNTLKPIVDFR